jgi:hypothetical protein
MREFNIINLGKEVKKIKKQTKFRGISIFKLFKNAILYYLRSEKYD